MCVWCILKCVVEEVSNRKLNVMFSNVIGGVKWDLKLNQDYRFREREFVVGELRVNFEKMIVIVVYFKMFYRFCGFLGSGENIDIVY